MSTKVFENILKDPEKMAKYKKDPLLEATFMALYAYKKAGYNFADLSWFVPSRKKRKLSLAA